MDTAITLDIDWAPDYAIDLAAQILIEHRTRATWFVTHDSPAVRRLRDHAELFELGIHPNFMTGSSHGASPGNVLRYCFGLVPDAVSMRTHGLVQSTRLLAEVLEDGRVQYDVSLFAPEVLIEPFRYVFRRRSLVRIPYAWEDSFSLENREPYLCLLSGTGTIARVCNFHPIHVFLNSRNMDAYESLKRCSPALQSAAETVAASCVVPGAGVRQVFSELAQQHAGGGLRIRDLGAQYEAKLDTAATGAGGEVDAR